MGRTPWKGLPPSVSITHTHTHTHAHTHAHTRTHTQRDTQTQRHTHAHTHRHKRTRTRSACSLPCLSVFPSAPLGYQGMDEDAEHAEEYRIFQLGTNNWQSDDEFAPGCAHLVVCTHRELIWGTILGTRPTPITPPLEGLVFCMRHTTRHTAAWRTRRASLFSLRSARRARDRTSTSSSSTTTSRSASRFPPSVRTGGTA